MKFRKNNISILILLLISIIAVSGCTSQQNVPPVRNIAETPSTADTTNATLPTTIIINIVNYKFMPDTIDIKVGQTITWKNQDTVAHTVTGTNKEFDSGNIQPQQSFSFTFNSPGTFEYSCLNHPSMPHGKVTVS